MEKLISLRLPNFLVCATSRPEADIQAALGSLASQIISLHDESGQKRDITDYVSCVVHSDRNMGRWTVEDKELVGEILSRKADWMFRWILCQLETLRRCLPAAIRQALCDLPKSLDKTYMQILLGITEER
ncbi:hypothetical protein BJV74DRAFT_466753 [Russula compacta]|nr:hypothetical protein BJV74DRAFT_466753 [Russula compacta]